MKEGDGQDWRRERSDGREEGEEGKAGQEVGWRDVSRVAAERAYTPNQIFPSSQLLSPALPHPLPLMF